MATAMLDGGADIRSIQEMLGHVSLDTTMVYTSVSIRKLIAIHAATRSDADSEGVPTDKADRASHRGEGGKGSSSSRQIVAVRPRLPS